MSYLTEILSSLRKSKNDNNRVKIGILGLGKTNLAILENLAAEGGVDIVLRDTRNSVNLPLEYNIFPTYFGKNALLNIDEDVLFLSPSINRSMPELADAAARGVIITSDCDEFFRTVHVPIFAVTGSDGKSTTTTLSSAILSASGINASAIGNIGTPYISAPHRDAYVTELSSFNLEYIQPKSFAAVITNITPNHLNFHGTFENYKRAKLNVLKNTERRILCYDDPECRKIAESYSLYAVFSTLASINEILKEVKAEHFYTREGTCLCADGKKIIDVRELSRHEDYNLKNTLASIALCGEYAKTDAIYSVLRNFRGLAHRCEHFLNYKGIDFYNSSIDTSPSRTASTLLSLNRRVSIILGGRGKGLSPDTLRKPLLKYAFKISLYGEERHALNEWLSHDSLLSRIPRGSFDSFDCAVEHALEGITNGDAVLLSPACTAYGEFTSFEERGECFMELIKKKWQNSPKT